MFFLRYLFSISDSPFRILEITMLQIIRYRALTTLACSLLAFNVNASIITEVLSGTDNGFGFSGLHHANGCKSMCGPNFSAVSLSANHTSFFNENNFLNGDNFVLNLTLSGFQNSLLTLSGSLNFNVNEGDLIGTINADFNDNVHEDTFFKFVKGSMSIGGINVPHPNSIDGTLFSLWGANSTAAPLQNSIGFDPATADLGLDLVVRWDDSLNTTNPDTTNVPEPAVFSLLGLGMLGMFGARRKKKSSF